MVVGEQILILMRGLTPVYCPYCIVRIENAIIKPTHAPDLLFVAFEQ